MTKEQVLTMKPHENAEKKHSRRFITEDFTDDSAVSDIYFRRPFIDGAKKIKITIEVVE